MKGSRLKDRRRSLRRATDAKRESHSKEQLIRSTLFNFRVQVICLLCFRTDFAVTASLICLYTIR